MCCLWMVTNRRSGTPQRASPRVSCHQCPTSGHFPPLWRSRRASPRVSDHRRPLWSLSGALAPVACQLAGFAPPAAPGRKKAVALVPARDENAAWGTSASAGGDENAAWGTSRASETFPKSLFWPRGPHPTFPKSLFWPRGPDPTFPKLRFWPRGPASPNFAAYAGSQFSATSSAPAQKTRFCTSSLAHLRVSHVLSPSSARARRGPCKPAVSSRTWRESPGLHGPAAQGRESGGAPPPKARSCTLWPASPPGQRVVRKRCFSRRAGGGHGMVAPAYRKDIP